ncbi:hypothetical protein [Lacicoccus alkaliphilus]|uniref:Cytochrome b561 n=1 Tax=Lacicoccus alkaliphilus DSM 16010 TaxID=1123231 RepID=A0A1M7F9B7_9BACL|nr:hypothetical protein [Salinicoccus alkaliphilus]SHM00368.1 hypothetical protein SAMN02745189_01371 [Salinicoccus alkaliphilus DSM 16010]
MSIWFLLNGALVIWAAWNVVQSLAVHSVHHHILLGFAGFLLFIFNWTRNAVFATIRKVDDRAVKIKLARFSKKIMPYHRWIGTLSFVLIALHALTVIHLYGFNPGSMKILTGLLASVNLFILVLSGWYSQLIRHNLKSRRVHIGLGISMFILTALHLYF